MSYLADLHKAHGIEVAGEAVYATLARLTRREDRRRKWLELERLEMETKRRVTAVINQLGEVPEQSRLDLWLGCSVGGVLALLPWRLKIRAMRLVVRHAMQEWQRMAERNPDGDPPLLTWLAEHEKAQYDFAVDELQDRTDRSLEHVTRMLNS